MEIKSELSGYCHSCYASSFCELGKPRELIACGGWIIERNIPGTSYFDGMGCYPLFTCKKWNKIHEDLLVIGADIVSVSMVTDPFGSFDRTYLEQNFNIVIPYKNHLVADIRQDMDIFINKKHRYKSRKALKNMQTEICTEPCRYFEKWVDLYQNLVKRHNITGLRNFSKESFYSQMKTPGMILVVGKLNSEMIAGMLVAIDNNVAYTHLSAFSETAYEINASFGIYWTALTYLKEKNIHFVDLGANSGINNKESNGLIRFKSGWSNTNRIVYLCGKILNNEKYDEICRMKNIPINDYFPAYRQGEFT